MSDELRDTLRALPVFEGELPDFDPASAPEEPGGLFLDWLGDAIERGVSEPHAMTLSTVDAYGRPDSRVLVLKGVEEGRLQFATSRMSRKGRQLTGVPLAAASFYWREIGRQVRVRGRVAEGTREDAAKDFLARAEDGRAAALASQQSDLLSDFAELGRAFTEAQERIAAEAELVPPHWSVYDLVPEEMEFWQARPDRRHVRLRYEIRGGGWSRSLRWP